MKRSVLMGITSIKLVTLALVTVSLSSCNWIPEEEIKANDLTTLRFGFTLTKGPEGPEKDTNSFILSVVNCNTEEIIYKGAYGERPAKMSVPSGSYDVSVISAEYDLPQFDSPQYGDSKVVIAKGGGTMNIRFLCTQTNCGVRLLYSDTFKSRYCEGHLLLAQNDKSIEYGLGESRTAYFTPGEVAFVYGNTSGKATLFSRNLTAGQIRNISVDATTDESDSSFSISVDTTTEEINEEITVGEEGGNGDGLSKVTALSPAELLRGDFSGDTVWVCGYIVGVISDDETVDFNCRGTAVSNNLAIADSPSERQTANCIGIYLSKAADKNALNLSDSGNYDRCFGHRIFVQGKVDVYKKIIAIKNICQWEVE